MGMLFELLTTPAVYAMPAWYDRHPPVRKHEPIRIPFGPARLQACVLWEPAHVTHETVVLWFHGGGYLVGTPQSMANAADVYNAQGYRFVSVGFRLMPKDRFPTQIADAFVGVRAAITWLRSRGIACERIVVGGSSAGGMSAALVAYSCALRARYGLDETDISCAIRGFVSCAAVLEVDDMLLDYIPTGPAGDMLLRLGIDLPATRRHGPGVINRLALHRELRPYSPMALLSADDLPYVRYFGVHGRADQTSPFTTEQKFSDRIAARLGPEAATLHVVDDPRWQHMVTTVTMHKRKVASDPVLSHLFAWLDDLEAQT